MSVVDRLRETWQEASARDRTLFGFGALVAIGALGYVLAWQPLDRDLAATESRLRIATQRAAWAQRTADEIAGLRRSAASPPTSDPRAAVERVVAARGLRDAMSSLDAQEGRIRVSFAAIEFAAFAALVEALGREERMFVVEALVAARVEPGVVRAEFALTRPALR